MANVFFCSDLHLDHKKIHLFRNDFGESSEEHDEKVIDGLCKVVGKRDILYVLGDAAFSLVGLHKLYRVPGNKVLVKGNHDTLHIIDYMKVFNDICGIVKYKDFWLTHAPIHEQELRDRVNIHGHVHYQNIPKEVGKPEQDKRYFNACVENVFANYGRVAVSLEEVREWAAK